MNDRAALRRIGLACLVVWSQAPTGAQPVFNGCFDPDLVADGTTSSLRYTRTGQTVGTIESDTTVADDASFNGTDGLIQKTTVTRYAYTRPVPFTHAITERTYSSQPGPDGMSQYGVEVSTSSPGVPPSTTTYAPAWADRTSVMHPGDSHTVTYTLTTSQQGHAAAMRATQTTRFVSLDTVTVPAGTFRQACHFQFILATSGGGNPATTSTSDEWFAGGSGVLIKSIDLGGEQQLTSGTVNGAPVH